MRILVVGGTGFVGEYVCRALVRAGASVVVVHGSPLKEKSIAGVEYRQIDLDKDFLKFKAVVSECTTIVFSIQPDILRMKKMLSLLSTSNAIEKVVYLSTLLVYPASDAKSSESVMPKPLTEYEIKKHKEEKLLAEFTRDYGCVLAIARLGNVYGDRKNRGVINYLMCAVTSDNTFIINGNGEQVRDYIFVEDVGRLLKFVILLEQENQKEIFNVCSGVGHSITQVLKLIEEIADKKIKIQFGKPFEEKSSVVADNTKLFKLSSLKLEYDLIAGLKKTYKNYLKLDKNI